jgi:hypothetical protein
MASLPAFCTYWHVTLDQRAERMLRQFDLVNNEPNTRT